MELSTVEELIAQQKWTELRELLNGLPLPEVAEALSNTPKAARVLVFNFLSRTDSGELFSYLTPEIQASLLTELTDREAGELLAKLRPDDRTGVLEELPALAISHLLTLLGPEDRQEAEQLLGYPDESVGRLMTPDYVSVLPAWSIQRALTHIRWKGSDCETISTIYITDENGKLLDALELHQFVLADPLETVESIMDQSFTSLSAWDDREEAVRMMQKYDLFALPVVDTNGTLLGIVTADDVLDVAEEEATEDIQKGAAVEPLKTSYRESGIWMLYRKRIPWLMALILVNLTASSVIAVYEEILASTLVLTFFIPMLMGSGGNTGAQAAMLMVRSLAIEDLKASQWLNTAWKELAVGSTLGLTMGIGAGCIGYAWGGIVVGVGVGLAMVAVVVVSNLLGVLFPVLLTKLDIDPAVASSPMVTSTTDVTSLILYFSIVRLVIDKLQGVGM
ncbi:magnesium transporter [Candidatus Nitrospira neomarina]|uniref:Magnesium transporter MgtE n=1 Tax=Candidatus Nitrospira neomarina TaxID=3020899 RepID=A0AA96GNR4_9BACT|nr:magnesium transporter [Candidatus Nitrospira neomarina]WNM62568.1 magnesium transporter [Candidatus Nitrospira neomarina]